MALCITFACPSCSFWGKDESKLIEHARIHNARRLSMHEKQLLVDLIQEVSLLPEAAYFLQPVDPVALNIPNYFNVIDKPMDLGTVLRKIEGDCYASIAECYRDLLQVNQTDGSIDFPQLRVVQPTILGRRVDVETVLKSQTTITGTAAIQWTLSGAIKSEAAITSIPVPSNDPGRGRTQRSRGDRFNP
jgi:hypothetical protein